MNEIIRRIKRQLLVVWYYQNYAYIDRFAHFKKMASQSANMLLVTLQLQYPYIPHCQARERL